MQRKSPFPASVSPEAAKNMNSVKVGPFSCFCLMKPGSGEHAPLGEEDNFDYDDAVPYTALPDADGLAGAQENNAHDNLPCWMKGPLTPGPVPPLAPLGGGGWHLEEYFEDEMRKVRDEALHLFRSERQEGDVPSFISDFLTPFTLFNYIRPHAPIHLKKTLLRRAEREQHLTCQVGQGIELVGSMRVLGFDGQGMSIVVSEPGTMKQSVGPYLDQVEYVSLTALDLNQPNPVCASGFIQFLDFGGGFNLTHFLDPRPCIALSQVWESVFRRRTKAVILLEMPKTFQAPMNLFLQLSKHSTRNKMRFCANPEEAIDELKKFGCDEETLVQFRNYMNERRSSQSPPAWHPIIDLPFFRERLASLRLNQDTPFLSGDAHRRFREAIQEFRIRRWGPPMRPVLETSSSSSSAEASSNRYSLVQVERVIASAIGGATATSNTRDNTKVETCGIGEAVVAPNLSATEPTSLSETSGTRQRPSLSCDTELKPLEGEWGRTMSGSEFTPCGGPSQKLSRLNLDHKKPTAIDAKRASATAARDGCATGIARMCQRAICCADVSRKPRVA